MHTAGFVRKTLIVGALFVVAACHRTASPATAPAAAAAPAAPKLPAGVTLAMIAEGDSLFNSRSCVRCHGPGAVGATNAPSLIRTTWDHGSGSYEDIVKTIIAGVPKEQVKNPARPFAMRPRGGMQPLLDDAQVNAVAAYIWSLNHPMK
jgi:mono/diheme cytochrome c family protein